MSEIKQEWLKQPTELDRLIADIRVARKDEGVARDNIILDLMERLAIQLRGPVPPKIKRIPDLTWEEYQALSDEEKQDRRDHQAAYAAQFPPGHYPLRDQLTEANQRYADGQRAEGYAPPGVYC